MNYQNCLITKITRKITVSPHNYGKCYKYIGGDVFLSIMVFSCLKGERNKYYSTQPSRSHDDISIRYG